MNRLAAAAALLALCAAPSFALTAADLDEPLTSFVTDQQGDFVAVCRALHTGCGVEVVDGVESLAASNSPLPRANRTARQILDEYVGMRPHDEWALVDGVLNLRPAMRPSPDWLSKKTGTLALRKMDGFQAALELLRRSGARLALYPSQAPFKPVDRTFKDVTIRQGLNAIAKADGELVWVVVHSKGGARLVLRGISFRERGPGTLNENPEASRVTERAIR